MITLLTGENSFEMERVLRSRRAEFTGMLDVLDGNEVLLDTLPSLLMGTSLFSEKRLIILKNLSDNKGVWPLLGDWLPRVADDIHLVLVEPKPDKRTKTYKELQKVAIIEEFQAWTDRDTSRAEQWVRDEAATLGVVLDPRQARLLVQRVGVDQWSLSQALQKLSVLERVTVELIEDVIEAQPAESVFALFEAALKGDSLRTQAMIATLMVTEDPYRLFGLLSGQAFQLATLLMTDRPATEVAKAIGAHPFALSKLVSYVKNRTRVDAKNMMTAFFEADVMMKQGGEPWLLIERALIKVAVAAR